jgi:nucleoid-associated protein YgaU
MNRPAAGFTTRRPEEPCANSASTVLWEPGRATAPATRRPQAAARPMAARSAALETVKNILTTVAFDAGDAVLT